MLITYDKDADAVYLHFDPENATKFGVVKKTIGDYPIHLDFTKEGQLFGVEILEASTLLDINKLLKTNFEDITGKPVKD